MTLEEARRTLGLSADEDPTTHFAEFEAARNRIAELVRTAPNDTIALRYQDGLIQFERALAALREQAEKDVEAKKRQEWMAAATGVPSVTAEAAAPEPVPVPFVPEAAPAPSAAGVPVQTAAKTAPLREAPVRELPPEKFQEPAPRTRGGALAAIFFLLLFGAVGGWFLYYKNEEGHRLHVLERVTFLEGLGARMIDARQWPEADAVYKEIEELTPGSKAALLGRRSIEAGMEEEQRQFVGYWSGEAIAAYELGRLEDAANAARKVLEKYPKQKEIADLLEKVEQARSTQAREALVSASAAAIQKHRWDEAEAKAKQLADAFPGDPEGKLMLGEIRAGREKEAKDRQRAKELFAAAKVRDQGRFDRDALEWLREAVALSPGDPEIDALYQKMASYTRTLQVPGDFATLTEAIASARDRDRIVVAEGIWAGPVLVDKAITLEGAGREKTIIEVEAPASTAATFGRQATGARISGITFRHRGFDAGENRFSALLVRGAEVTMNDCRVVDSAGHGLAVMEAGQVAAIRCLFENNGWDGVAVRGAGSRIEFTRCESNGNFGHGFDLWEGGAGAIHECVARDNSANGILVETTGDNVVVANSDLRANREYGIVVSAAGSGRVHGNQCRENLLGGIAVRFAATKVTVENNVLEKNQGPGLALERGLAEDAYATNRSTANAGGKNTVTNADFSSGE
jgi:tetratricopeptide (TPR) repeat protein